MAPATTAKEGEVDNIRSAPGIRKWRIGKVTATRILEMDTLVIPPESMLKTSTGTVLEYDWLQSHYATPKGRLLTHIQAFVLEIATFDHGGPIGNHKPRLFRVFQR